MELKTKRELGDKVFVIYKEKIQQLEIDSIHLSLGAFSSDKSKVSESYWLKDADGNLATNMLSEKTFSTKEELIEVLSK